MGRTGRTRRARRARRARSKKRNESKVRGERRRMRGET